MEMILDVSDQGHSVSYGLQGVEEFDWVLEEMAFAVDAVGSDDSIEEVGLATVETFVEKAVEGPYFVGVC